MGPVGALQAGIVAEHFGAPVAVGAGGLLTALAVAVVWWRVPEAARGVSRPTPSRAASRQLR